jgi:hypothetical protein
MSTGYDGDYDKGKDLSTMRKYKYSLTSISRLYLGNAN